MNSRFRKAAIAATCGGMAVAFNGCLNSGKLLSFVAKDATLSAAYEFMWDNDAVVDFFQDDHGTATVFDDRFSANSSRTEPAGAMAF